MRRLLVRFLFFVPNRLCCTREYTYIRHVAAAEGHLDICKFLVENGAHINRSDRWGASPLDDAYRHKHTKVLKYLRIHGAISGSSNQVANFITAAAEGDIDEVRTLLELFVDDTTGTISGDGEQQLQLIDKGDYDRRTALHLAAGEGHGDVVELLCQVGANVNVEDRWNKRPLDDAKRVGHVECIEILERYGAKQGSSDAILDMDSITSLITAAASGDVEYVKLLIDNGSLNLDEGDYDKRTALHLAAGEGHEEVVRLLCEAGANPNVIDRWGNRPMDDAILTSSLSNTDAKLACQRVLESFGAKRGSNSIDVGQEALLDLLHQHGKVRDGENDPNSVGPTLDWHDVKDLLHGIGQDPTDEVIQKLFEVADEDNDGLIKADEFLTHSDTFLAGKPARIILVVGGPGSGKGLLCERLAKECGVVHLSSGDLLRAEVAKGTQLGKQVDEIMKSGGLVSSAMMVTLMNKRMKDHPGKRILLDGFPRSQENAKDLVTLCGKPELALHLDCDDTVLLERIMKRGESGERADDNFQTALQRIRNYHKYHNVTLDFLREEHVPIVFLDCATTPDGVWDQLRGIARLMRPAVRLPNGNHHVQKVESDDLTY